MATNTHPQQSYCKDKRSEMLNGASQRIDLPGDTYAGHAVIAAALFELAAVGWAWLQSRGT